LLLSDLECSPRRQYEEKDEEIGIKPGEPIRDLYGREDCASTLSLLFEDNHKEIFSYETFDLLLKEHRNLIQEHKALRYNFEDMRIFVNQLLIKGSLRTGLRRRND
jgi:hypothetical protein